jgi:hypothetical protein
MLTAYAIASHGFCADGTEKSDSLPRDYHIAVSEACDCIDHCADVTSSNIVVRRSVCNEAVRRFQTFTKSSPETWQKMARDERLAKVAPQGFLGPNAGDKECTVAAAAVLGIVKSINAAVWKPTNKAVIDTIASQMDSQFDADKITLAELRKHRKAEAAGKLKEIFKTKQDPGRAANDYCAKVKTTFSAAPIPHADIDGVYGELLLAYARSRGWTEFKSDPESMVTKDTADLWRYTGAHRQQSTPSPEEIARELNRIHYDYDRELNKLASDPKHAAEVHNWKKDHP